MMNLQPPKGGKKKKKLCILKLASLQGYLLLQHNLTILTDTEGLQLRAVFVVTLVDLHSYSVTYQ